MCEGWTLWPISFQRKLIMTQRLRLNYTFSGGNSFWMWISLRLHQPGPPYEKPARSDRGECSVAQRLPWRLNQGSEACRPVGYSVAVVRKLERLSPAYVTV